MRRGGGRRAGNARRIHGHPKILEDVANVVTNAIATRTTPMQTHRARRAYRTGINFKVDQFHDSMGQPGAAACLLHTHVDGCPGDGEDGRATSRDRQGNHAGVHRRSDGGIKTPHSKHRGD